MKTLARPVDLEGVGVHSGRPARLGLRPSAGGGIVFRRTDLGGAELALRFDRIESRNSTTLVGDRFKVRTVEHLLAALYAFGADDLIVELNAEEMPILDGSALPFARAAAEAGLKPAGDPARPLALERTILVEEKDAWVRYDPPARPGEAVLLEYTIVFDHPAIGRQSLGRRLTPEVFLAEIAPARTFGFLKDVEFLRGQGLARGASMDNTVVLDSDKVVNPPLRFPDEFVRHKLLDLAGDLALLGRPLEGKVSAHKAGHRLHGELVRRLLAAGA